MKMNAQVTKLQAAEDDLKELMADITRAIKKAEEAIGPSAKSGYEQSQQVVAFVGQRPAMPVRLSHVLLTR
jgi:cell fate (sporulation/competence/biofilm development) regulator YlbF (YheA/YmcA/DUF963 family)